MSKHSNERRGVTTTTPTRLYAIEIVDADTSAIPLVTHDAIATGRRRGGRYAAARPDRPRSAR